MSRWSCFLAIVFPCNKGELTRGRLCGVWGPMQQLRALVAMPLRGLRLDTPLAALRSDAMRILMLRCAAIDTPY